MLLFITNYGESITRVRSLFFLHLPRSGLFCHCVCPPLIHLASSLSFSGIWQARVDINRLNRVRDGHRLMFHTALSLSLPLSLCPSLPLASLSMTPTVATGPAVKCLLVLGFSLDKLPIKTAGRAKGRARAGPGEVIQAGSRSSHMVLSISCQLVE